MVSSLAPQCLTLQFASTSYVLLLCVPRMPLLQETCLPGILQIIDRRIESQINFGYDVGRGFVVGEEECRELLDHIVEQPGMREEFKNRCDKKRLAVIKELGKTRFPSLWIFKE